MKTLEGKLAVVTGAGGGIGAALCSALADAGARVCLTDLRSEAVETVAAGLRGAGHEVHVDTLDVSDPDAVVSYASHVEGAYGGADLLINNAGLSVHGPFAKHSFADIDRVIGVNLRGVAYGCRAFFEQLSASGDGHIVNIGSMAGRVPFPHQSTYCATKYGVRGLSEVLRMEFADANVGVTTVMPGAVATTFLDNAHSYDRGLASRMSALMLKHGVPPERVAARTLRAVRRNQAEVALGIDDTVFRALEAATPTLLRGAFRTALRRFG